jgi:hypothetical protein
MQTALLDGLMHLRSNGEEGAEMKGSPIKKPGENCHSPDEARSHIVLRLFNRQIRANITAIE